MLRPGPDVLDLFAVPDAVEPVPGGDHRVRAGDLVLTPGRDAGTAAWLSPVLARLAVGLDERPGRRRRDLRVAMPVPARDGSWVAQGWAACRWEPGTQACIDLEVTLAAGRLLHAELASVVGSRPAGVPEPVVGPAGGADQDVVRRVVPRLAGSPVGVAQLVHAELAGSVYLDAAGAPVVLGLAPAWAPVRWAEALCVLDAVVGLGADPALMAAWSSGPDRQAMLRAVLHRSSGGGAGGRSGGSYASVLDALGV